MSFFGEKKESCSFRATCKKCGYSGHLAFQCRNTIVVSFLKIYLEHQKSLINTHFPITD